MTEEQQSSYDAQMNYYSEFIQSHRDWEFVRMYSDEGITGTSTAHRDGFNRMIEDALDVPWLTSYTPMSWRLQSSASR